MPLKTNKGVADFHAGRGTHIRNPVASGSSVKTCQTLARHADPAHAIGIYAKASLHDVQSRSRDSRDSRRRCRVPKSRARSGPTNAGKPRR